MAGRRWDEIRLHVTQEARRRMRDARESHGWDHVLRVRTLALRIAGEEGAREDVVEAAALLHDVGRRAEEESGGRLCHAASGARESERVLEEVGAGEELVDAVSHCVAAHRFRGAQRPESLEARVLFDADKLDAIGAVGLGRAFLFAGEVGARLHNPEADPQRRPERGREDSALREFLVKLRHVKDGLHTGAGRRIAAGRHAFMEAFFERLEAEVRGEA